MKEQKIAAVAALDAPGRYSYFIKQAADNRCVWGLWSDGWALATLDDEDTTVFPIWPDKVFAQHCANGPWDGYEAKEIDLDYLLEELTPKLQDQGIMFSVFRTNEQGSVAPPFELLINDIRTELSRIE